MGGGSAFAFSTCTVLMRFFFRGEDTPSNSRRRGMGSTPVSDNMMAVSAAAAWPTAP